MEIIRFGTPNAKQPLLFVHGSYCGAWIWERNFMPYFAGAGYYGAAISLKGHGKNEDVDQIDQFGVSDFLEDIADGVKLFSQKPILIGHSLGGYLVQRYALENEVPGMILLSAPSLAGLGGSSQHILVNNPQLAFQLGLLMSFGPGFADPEVIANALFLDGVPAEEKERMIPLLQRESKRIMAEAFWPNLMKPEHPPKTLIVGGDKDVFVPMTDWKYEAACWDGEMKILQNVPHGVMLDPSWTRVADEVKNWLQKTFP